MSRCVTFITRLTCVTHLSYGWPGGFLKGLPVHEDDCARCHYGEEGGGEGVLLILFMLAVGPFGQRRAGISLLVGM